MAFIMQKSGDDWKKIMNTSKPTLKIIFITPLMLFYDPPL